MSPPDPQITAANLTHEQRAKHIEGWSLKTGCGDFASLAIGHGEQRWEII
jgi:hypothetical protein